MGKYLFDYEDGDFAMPLSDNIAMDSNGDWIMRIGDNMALDMDSGDIHLVPGWPSDTDN